MQLQERHDASVLTATVFHDLARWSVERPGDVDALYASPHAVQAVFRAIPPLARLYVSRLLFLPDGGGFAGEFRQCLKRRQRAHDRHDAAFKALKAFRVFVDNGADTGLRLNEAFGAALRLSVATAVEPVFGGPFEDGGPGDIAALDAHSGSCLERILNFLVESNGSDSPSQSIMRALMQTRILEQRREGLCISSVGFQFLLKDSFAQVWVLLRSVINHQHKGNELDALNFVFQLSFACVGKLYSSLNLSVPQQALLSDLAELGVVMVQDAHYFRPTPVGVGLLTSASRISTGPAAPTSGTAGSTLKSAGTIQVFVETNFRVYAYTTSNFQTNLMALFTHMRYRLPNMVVGHLTRDAVRRALMNGISGDQIIGYLNAHAHPRMKKGCIPSNVSDEIRLWEAEQERVQTTPGILLDEFESQASFDQVQSYADDVGARLWTNAASRKLIVAQASYEKVKSFIRNNNIQ